MSLPWIPHLSSRRPASGHGHQPCFGPVPVVATGIPIILFEWLYLAVAIVRSHPQPMVPRLGVPLVTPVSPDVAQLVYFRVDGRPCLALIAADLDLSRLRAELGGMPRASVID